MQMKAQILAVLGVLFMSFGAFAQDREEAMVMSLGDTSSGRWSTTYFSISGVDNMSYGKKEPGGGRSWSGYHYFSLNYKIDQDKKASLKLPFVYQSEGWDAYGTYVSQRADLQDVFAAISFYDLGYIGPVDISGSLKLYAPTSQMSQDSGMITRLRGEFFFEYNFTRFSSIQWVVKPGAFIQSRTSYFNTTTPTYDDGGYRKDPRSTTKQYELEHYIEVVADINKYFAVKPKLGFDENWYNGSVANNLEPGHVTKAVGGIGLEIRPLRQLNMTLSFQNETTLGSYNGKDVAYWQPENTSYNLMVNAFLFNL